MAQTFLIIIKVKLRLEKNHSDINLHIFFKKGDDTFDFTAKKCFDRYNGLIQL